MFKRVAEYFTGMFRRKAFLHWHSAAAFNVDRKGTKGVNTNGVTANDMLLTGLGLER